MAEKITVAALVAAPVQKVWAAWTTPADIMAWNAASPDWHCPASTNDLRAGGSFSATMAARDGSFSFDFGGVYDEVDLHKKIAYTMADGRRCEVFFVEKDGATEVTEIFDPETENPPEMQKAGWQAILDNFKTHVESKPSVKKRLRFTLTIAAPRERVWQILWSDATYPKWTSAFSEGSRAESDWQLGSKVHFLAAEGGGMIARIAEKIEDETMVFEHLGEIKKDGSEVYDQSWSGAQESYFLTDAKWGGTDLRVELDTIEDWEDYMKETFPKALNLVRELSQA